MKTSRTGSSLVLLMGLVGVGCAFQGAEDGNDPAGSGAAAGAAGSAGSAGQGGAAADSAVEDGFEADADVEVVSDGGHGPEATLISPDLMLALMGLPYGHSLDEIGNVAGAAELSATLDAGLAETGPVALCSNLTIPVSANGCASLDAGLVNRGSFDPNNESLGLEALETQLSAESVCGVGQHSVSLTVYDQAGLASTCTSAVRLCDAGDADCPAQLTRDDVSIAVNNCSGKLSCEWVATTSAVPDQGSGTMWFGTGNVRHRRGPGPLKGIEAIDGQRSCYSSDSDDDDIVDGRVTLQVGLVCKDATGAKCDPGCVPQFDVQGVYRSRIRARSALGSTCLWDSNETEALASDETALDVGGSQVFAKGIAMTNGSTISTTYSFELGAQLGKSKDGLAADASLTLGYSVTRTDNTSPKSAWDRLNAEGGRSVQAQSVKAVLDAKGRGRIRSRYRAFGAAEVMGDDWLLYYAATSTCPLPNQGGGAYAGLRGYSIVRDIEVANDFWKVKGIDYSWAQ